MKISVVVPVYNTECYLKKCINSIIAQTYTNWELILVDDGSTDRSWQIIENAAEKDSRIIATHQENSGPGRARNNGLDIASGDYVVFIDSATPVAGETFQPRIQVTFGKDGANAETKILTLPAVAIPAANQETEIE